MTATRTNADWASLIDAARASIRPASAAAPTPNPVASRLRQPISAYIDHTQLSPTATAAQIAQLCTEATSQAFAAVCVRPGHVAAASSQVRASATTPAPPPPCVAVACVVGFHEGDQATAAKVAEAQRAVADGAAELDVVLNRAMLGRCDYEGVVAELRALRSAVPDRVCVKLILETSQLGVEQVVAACVLAGYAGCDFVKTSTGFCGRGASVEDVLLMSAVAEYLEGQGVGRRDGEGRFVRMKVKASGGVRSFDDAVRMIGAGAQRIGTSSGMKIVQEAKTTMGSQVESASNDAAVSRGPNDY